MNLQVVYLKPLLRDDIVSTMDKSTTQSVTDENEDTENVFLHRCIFQLFIFFVL